MVNTLIAVHSFPPDFSGAGLRALRTAERLNNKYGISFQVLCNGKHNIREKIGNITVQRIKFLKEEGIFFPFHVIQLLIKSNRYLIANKKSIDIIHFFSFPWMNRMIMLANILFYKKKTILEVTLEGSDDPKSLITEGKRNILFRFFTKYLLKKIDKIIVSSSDGLNSCLETGIEKRKVSIEPHPCDEKIFGSINFKKKMELRRKLGLPKDKFILLNIGRIQNRKNQLFIIEALEKLKKQDILLILIGPFDENDKYFAKVKQFVKAKNLGKRVLVMGEKKDINEYMIAADLLVFASKKEGFPNVIAETIVSGLPIVTTSLACITPYLNEENGILLQNHDKFDMNVLNQYSSAIKKVYNNPKRYNRNSIRKFGIKYLSSKKLDEEKNNQYMELLKEK